MSKHSTLTPFLGETTPAHQLDDYFKAGRQVDLWQWWWIRVLHSDFTDADGSQAIDLATLAIARMATQSGSRLCSGLIPPDAIMGWWTYDLREVFAGGVISAATVIAGVSGDTNGHLESTNVFTGATLGRKRTAAATAWAPTVVTAPLLQLDTTTGTVAAATSGCIDVYARFSFDPASQYYDGADT